MKCKNKKCRIKTLSQTHCKNFCLAGENMCVVHRKKYFDKSNNCPVCYCSLATTYRPQICGHWVHTTCIKKTGKNECPICRKELNFNNLKIKKEDDISELFNHPETVHYEVPNYIFAAAKILQHLFSLIGYFNLQSLISLLLSDYVPLSTEAHQIIMEIIYSEGFPESFDSELENSELENFELE